MKKSFLAIFFCIFELLEFVSPQYHYSHYHEPVKIGGLFDEGSDDAQLAFRYAVKYVNTLRHKSIAQISETSKQIMYGNEFNASQTVCSLIEQKVIGIIGPTSPESAVFVRSLCDTKEIPLMETFNDGTSKHTINMHPTPDDLGAVYLEMIYSWDWKGFTILYEDASWLPMVEYILRNYNKRHTITLRQLDLTADGNYREPLRRVKSSDDYNIVLCSSIESLPEILKQAQQVGLLTSEHRVIITSLDMHTIDLEPYQYSGTNITGFRMISPGNEFLTERTNDFKDWFKKEARKKFYTDQDDEELPEGLTPEKILLKTALTFDAVLLFHSVMLEHQNMDIQGVDCNDRKSIFINGTSIFNSMKTFGPLKGLSGEIQFDQLGNRESFKLEILELTSAGLEVIATWDQVNKIQTLKKPEPEPTDNEPHNIRNKTLNVVISIQAPYAMLKENSQTLIGNEQYEGFAVELIEELAKHLEFKYNFIVQEDGAVGRLEGSQWTGMIGKLMAGIADLAICDLTITAEREAVIDFTMPFMTLGIGILYERPKPDDPKLFSFLDPFSPNVWKYLLGFFFLVSLSLFIMGRMSPAEWDNPYPCIEEPEVLINQFSFKNAMWFTIGALLQQGSEIAPKAPSTRIVASMWWFFTLIMVSSYTANLAAFLTIEDPKSLVNGVQDLIDGKAEYGAKEVGSTVNFFRDSTKPDYKKMYEVMLEKKTLMKSNDDGLHRAEKGQYAFLMESSTIEYLVQRHCNVTSVGPTLDEKGYGIGMKKQSPFRGALSEAILQLQESGEISRLKTKWWKEKRGGGQCSNSDDGGSNKALDMRNVGGVFVVVSGGCILALVMGVVQWLLNMRKISKTLEIPYSEVFKEEFRFFRKFGTHVKSVPVRKSSTRSGSANGSNSRSRSTNNVNNSDSIGFRMSLKNLHKIPRDEAFDKI